MKKVIKSKCSIIKKAVKYVLGVTIMMVIGVMYSCEKATDAIVIQTSDYENSETTEVADSSMEATSFNYICIHVTGCVERAGVYELKEGSRVFEAIEMAGGFTKEADTEFLNLASVLQDGQKVYVYSKQEAITAVTSYVSNEEDASKKVIVNINTASKEELMTLPGIGESRAESIISYREKHGRFATIEDIMNISGIKEAAFNKIKDYIRVN